MDRNTITGFLLIFAMVIVYQLYFVPVPEVTETAQTQEIPTPETEEQIVALPTAMDPGDDSTYVARTGAAVNPATWPLAVSTDGGNLDHGRTPRRLSWTSGAKSPFSLWTEGGSDVNWVARGEGFLQPAFRRLGRKLPDERVVLDRRAAMAPCVNSPTASMATWSMSRRGLRDARGEVGLPVAGRWPAQRKRPGMGTPTQQHLLPRARPRARLPLRGPRRRSRN